VSTGILPAFGQSITSNLTTVVAKTEKRWPNEDADILAVDHAERRRLPFWLFLGWTQKKSPLLSAPKKPKKSRAGATAVIKEEAERRERRPLAGAWERENIGCGRKKSLARA
jgi:hypothetical protein